ncbi:hypothetical protein J4419_03650 [Candidatus Woesearchaeota archaeon]|nr:hypothetical protein [Candidatus Woesearchaeota archaeon]
MPKKLMWVDIHEKRNKITPIYYFDYDLLNQLGFPDSEMLKFIEETKRFAEKEIKEREESDEKKEE